MATEKALQLVTLTVADLLSDRMVRNDVAFTFARPLTPAASATPSPRLNLYLYQLLENPAFRNEEEPTQAIPGQYGSPPLALSLYYLITSYGKPTEIAAPENGAAFPLDSLTELDAQYILADAMRVLHDTPIITRNTPRLRAAAPPQIMDPGLQSDFESIRIVPRQMSLEDLTKVWTAFKEDFQRSVGYEVTIVRVQRPQQRPANAPVLRRNIPIVPSVSPAMSIVLATAAATTDSSVYFSGNGLGDPSLRIQITDASRLGYPPAPVLLTPQTDANNLTYFQIPSANPLMQPGPKLIQAVITAPAPGVRPVASAPVPLTLLPNIATINPQSGPFNGTVSVTISGTALGVAFSDPTLPPSPMVPAVLFGGYVVPFTDLDLTGLPSTIVATLNAQPATSPQPPSGSTPVPVRVRVNGVENQGWQLDPVTGQYGFLAGLLYTPS
jgi:hypothetical protein